ncbi:MAG: hypothetical protein RL094_511 [Candidatus Parcubacteria bacterium]|jgi:1-acyl-sn-glycerol-3-phosphate acyltransferase
MNSDSKFIAFTYFVLRAILRPIIKTIWIKKTTGIQHIPTKGPAIIAFNHQSFFDFLCFSVVAPRNVHFLSAEKFFYHKLWKHLMKFTGQIKVERHVHDKSDVHESVRKHLAKGMLVGIFPEGTRSPHEHEMLKAFTGVGKFTLEHRVPVIPVGIKGTYAVLSNGTPKLQYNKVVEIHVGEPLHFSDHHGKHTDKQICQLVTEKVMKKIEVLSGKTYPHYELNHDEQ